MGSGGTLTAAAQLWLDGAPIWYEVTKHDRRGAALADRHYSRQTVGDAQYLPPGETLALLHEGGSGLALWGVCLNMDPVGNLRWRCTIFRNESGDLSSDLIRLATTITVGAWMPRPPWPLTTEIDPRRVRRKRDPGRCFLRAGWRKLRVHRRLVVLVAPGPWSAIEGFLLLAALATEASEP